MLLTSDTKSRIKDRMVDVINYVEETEGVQIAVSPHFFNRFANLTYASLHGHSEMVNEALFSDFYKNLLNELNKFRNNIMIDSNIITKINNFAD